MIWEDLRVLVVDDNANIRRLIGTILQGVNVKSVREAANGHTALEILRSFPVDLVLLDYVMEDMNGPAVMRAIRGEIDRDGRRVPVIVVTGYSEVARLNEAKEAGANDFIAKPFTTKTLLQRIARALSQDMTLKEMETLALQRQRQLRVGS